MHWLEITVSVLASLALAPVAFFFECFPCCGEPCGVADGKPRTDPANEGTWVPSGTWRGVGGVTWSFTANPGDDSGETWFFYGSASTSKVGGFATVAERQDWGNICNWYSNKTNSPSTLPGLSSTLDKRATRLPPAEAVVHIYTSVSTVTTGPQTVQYAYFWFQGDILLESEITSTAAAHDSVGGAVFNDDSDNNGTVNGGATFNDVSRNLSGGTVNGGATFNDDARNFNGTVNGGATFNDSSDNAGTVNDGAVFNDSSENVIFATVNGGAVFNESSENGVFGTVNGGATFNDDSDNNGTVNGGATFNDGARNLDATVNDGAVFNESSENGVFGTVNGGAVFNDSSKNVVFGTVNGGATFNDAACSERTTGDFFSSPCDRKFVAHPTDLPVCNGTAPDGCANSADTCGCG
jgi:hypothetical protein